MYLPPELLAHIASFLDAESCFTCVSVCRQWNQFFAPYLWHTVKISEQPWSRLFSVRSSSSSQSRPPSQQQQQLISCLIKNYGRYIRVLEMDTAWLLWGAMIGRVNGLLSLTFSRPSPSLARSDLVFEGCQIADSETVPYSIFDVQPKDYSSPDFKMTLACWYMVLNNRDLQHIAFQQQHQGLGDVPLKIQKDGDHVYQLTPAGRSFLINLLSPLSDLRYIEIGQNADDFLLASLAEHFPMVTSFVHLGTMACDPSVLPRFSCRHSSLQSLSFKMSDFLSIDAEQLRWIVTAFPGLQHLSVPGYFSGALLGSLGWDDIDNCSIRTLSVSDFAYTAMEADLSVFEKARITFRAVKELKRTGEEYEMFGDLFRILRFFPCLEQFEFARDAVFFDPLVGGSIGGCGGIGAGFVDGRDSVYRFETLALGYEARLSLDAIEQLTSQSPFLTRVALQDIHPSVVRALAYSCQALEFVHFNTDETCSLELNTLLVHCPGLKECTGRGHVVFTTDILRSPHWTCLSLQKLDITIVDVPRRKGEKARLLEKARKRIRRVRGQHGVVHDMDLDIPEQQQQSAMEPQQNSQLCQRKVFSKLARLTQLEEIDFRYRPSEGPEEAYEGVWEEEKIEVEEQGMDEGETGTDVCEQYWDSLDFTLEAGLEQLGILNHLRMIAVGVDGGAKFGQREREWVWERWSMREKVEEEGVFCVEDLL
ncbi:hypothetical protein BGZ47_007692 [Haplosporangium gracile]|nr:hypothetical protein BGZ47_007692 [Haplosporangium gracile]